ncbi:MAG: histidine phosphatase family protein [Anaerolineales bacterium]|jgi:probable phosphomutase (TIGR03848 family)
MTTILLIRHAENDFVKTGKLAGRLPDVHLNARGKLQAEALAEVLRPVRLRAIFSSPLERALETAAPLAAAKKKDVIVRENLGEIHYGKWQGASLKRLYRRKLWRIIQSIPSLARFPEGESFPEAQARIVSELETLRAQYGTPKAVIACIFHSDPIKLALAHYIGLPLDLFQRLTISPASISILQVHGAHVRLVGLNDRRATLAAERG